MMIVTRATSQTSTFGSIRTTIPIRMRTTPGVIVSANDGGFSDIPLYIDAIGHIVIGTSREKLVHPDS